MLKTLKRKIALVAVAGLGLGLSVAIPAANAALTATGQANFQIAGTTTAVTNAAGAFNAGAGAAVETVYVRSTAAANTFKVNFTNLTAADIVHISMSSNAGGAVAATAAELVAITKGANPTGGTCAQENVTTAGGAVGDTTKGIACTETATGTVLTDVSFTTGALAAGTYTIWVNTTADVSTGTTYKIATVTSYTVGAPTTISYDVVGRTKIKATAEDSSFTASVKDSLGRSTFLVGDEQLTHSWDTVASGITAPATPAATTAGSTPAYTSGTATFAGYTVAIDITDPTGLGPDATKNTLFKLNSTIISGLAAYGTASATFRWSNTTSGLTGTLQILKTADSSVVTSISLAANGTVAAGTYQWSLKDSTGAVIQGILPTSTSSAGSTIASNTATAANGKANAFTYTAAATGGTDTLTFTVQTGNGTSISTSVGVTVTGYGATAAVLGNATVAVAAGTGWKAGTAPAYTAGLTVNKVTIAVTGIDVGTVADVVATPTGGTLTSTVSTAAPVADASGKITFDVSTTNAADTNSFTVTVDADGAGGTGAVTVATITYATAVSNVSTSPLTNTTNFAAPSTTKDIVATVADQFGIAAPGATVTLTNTSVPAGATAQTTVTKTVGADGKATLSAVLGSVVGNYVYQVTAADYNGVARATTNTITYTVTASGAPKSITITGGANTATQSFRVVVDNDGDIATNGATAVAYTTATQTAKTTTESKPYTTITVKVTDDAGNGVSGVNVVAAPGDGVLVNNAAAGSVKYSAFNEAADLTVASNGTGVSTFYVTSTKPGTASITFTAGSSTVTGKFEVITESQLDTPAIKTGRAISLDKSTAALNGNVVQITATVKDVWGNPVSGVALSGAITGTAGRFTGGARTQAAVNSDANGQVVFEVTSNGVEAGTGTLTITAGEGNIAGNVLTTLISDDLTANSSTKFTKTSTKSATAALTVTASTAASSPEITAVKSDVASVKTDVKAVSDTVAT
ncbi:MAG: hypothetical protein EBU96_09095, partial [Actinobacteria bacterium]|nr:hypothetical protein [Actinomycetota bacterium]